MADTTASAQSISKSIYNAGWRQGKIFELPGGCFLCNTRPDSDAEDQVKMHQKPVRAREQLVLASQDCDIWSDDEPNLEALVCKTKNKAKDLEHLDKVARNSARVFVIDRNEGLIVDARYRLIIAKDLLLESAWLHGTQMDAATLNDFKSWLGRRFDRPAVTDFVQDNIIRPLVAVFDALEDGRDDILDHFSSAVREVRFGIEADGSCDGCRLLLVLQDDEMGEEEASSVTEVSRLLQESFQERNGCGLEVDLFPYSEVLYRQVQATQPLFLDYLSNSVIEEGS
jgi:hypothetical protein